MAPQAPADGSSGTRQIVRDDEPEVTRKPPPDIGVRAGARALSPYGRWRLGRGEGASNCVRPARRSGASVNLLARSRFTSATKPSTRLNAWLSLRWIAARAVPSGLRVMSWSRSSKRSRSASLSSPLRVLRKNSLLIALDVSSPSCDNRQEQPPMPQRRDTLTMARCTHLPRHLVQLAGTLLTLLVDAFRYFGLLLRSPGQSHHVCDRILSK